MNETGHAPISVYGAALDKAVNDRPAPLHIWDSHGNLMRCVDARQWSFKAALGDEELVWRCPDRTMDLGCGVGRLTLALAQMGRHVLGVDISGRAVSLARGRGAPVLEQDVFKPLPDEGSWECTLLADGNVGIGGDPIRLLARCKELLSRTGSVVVELDPPGYPTWAGPVRVTDGSRTSTLFDWAFLSVDDITSVGEQAQLRHLETWMESNRWFARLGH